MAASSTPRREVQVPSQLTERELPTSPISTESSVEAASATIGNVGSARAEFLLQPFSTGALRQLGRRARDIALIEEHTSDAQLDDLAHDGVRGIRLNFVDLGVPEPAMVRQRFQAAIKRLAGRDWHIQIYSNLSVVEALQDDVLAAPLPVVFDHFTGALASLGVSQPGFGVLLKLIRSGKAYAKISATYRVSDQEPEYPKRYRTTVGTGQKE